jgi:hypothetical protein
VSRSLFGPFQQSHIRVERINATDKGFPSGQPQGESRGIGKKVDDFQPPHVHDEIDYLVDREVIIQAGSPLEKSGDSLLVSIYFGREIRQKWPRMSGGEVELLLKTPIGSSAFHSFTVSAGKQKNNRFSTQENTRLPNQGQSGGV